MRRGPYSLERPRTRGRTSMQGYQARVAALLVETELELRQRLRSATDLDGIEAAAKGVADGFARRLVEDLLAGADEVVAKSLPRSWRVVGFRTRNLLSTVGPLRLTRRLDRDHKGRARLPLDQELGVAPQVRATARLQEVAVGHVLPLPVRAARRLVPQECPARARPRPPPRHGAAVCGCGAVGIHRR